MDVYFLREMVIGSLRAPQAVARRLLALDLPMQARLMALVAVVALSAAFGTAAEMLFAYVTKVDLGAPTPPLPMALLQGGLILYGAWAMTFFGNRMGGNGRFADALVLVIWIEVMLLVGQMLQILLMVFFPIISVIGSIALIALLFWLLTQFTAALHGFDNLARVGIAVVLVFVGSGMLAGTILVSLGVVPTPVEM